MEILCQYIWDIAQLVRPYNSNISIIEFHEVTKKAILRAIKEKRNIDLNLVKGRLSAGRVQTPFLGWIIQVVSFTIDEKGRFKIDYS
ncbi:MAG: hypothetical protein N2504_06430 [candidate division WOR-3 bacterium]|nr:hypothetical protein [candidate division WOR-3 bacterium]MCX7948205.1 hypothetical protein [candidate division WOR-3 bacterium]MDW8150007.1 hypothetical protein [candidate division WOR-3 bacterium]